MLIETNWTFAPIHLYSHFDGINTEDGKKEKQQYLNTHIFRACIINFIFDCKYCKK